MVNALDKIAKGEEVGSFMQNKFSGMIMDKIESSGGSEQEKNELKKSMKDKKKLIDQMAASRKS